MSFCKKLFLLGIILTTSNLLIAQSVSTLINDSTRSFEAIHWHPDGRIYVADFNNGRLYQVYTDGTIQTLLTGIPNIAGGGFGGDGHFYFSGLATGEVYRLNPDHTATLIARGFNQPTGILQSSATDTLLVAQYGNNAVAKLSLNGQTITPWINGNGINGPDGIINGFDGTILIANFNDQNIQRVNPDGEISQFSSLPFAGFTGYITKADNHIYVPSIAGKRVFKVDIDGNATVLAGDGSTGNEDGIGIEATFNNPNGIASSPTGDTILVTDDHRIRMITNLAMTTNISDIPLINDLSISPNPTMDYLNVSFDLETANKFSWRIFNQQGQLLLQDTLKPFVAGKNQLQISVAPLTLGTYTLHITDDKGRAIQRLFIKSK